MEDELVYNFKLVANVVRGGIRKLMYGTSKLTILKRDPWDCV